jgi:branched-chain amino acid transport system substrate-binding protein
VLLIAALALTACGGGAADTGNTANTGNAPDSGDTANAGNTTNAGDSADSGDDMMAEPTFGGMTLSEAEAAGFVVIAPGDPLRLGASAALTGPIPEFGLDISQAYQLAVSDINAAGGVLGHELTIDIQDGACDGDAATVVANGFAADPTILAVAGGTCTGETFGLQPILQQALIPHVTSSATNPDITSEECTVCNRVALNDDLQASVVAPYMFNELGLTSIAIMHDNGDYGLGLAELVQGYFEGLGGTVVAFEGIQVGDTDFRAALTKIAASEPEAVYFGGYATEGGLIAAQMKEVGLEDAVFFSDDGVYGQAFIDAAGAAAEGAFVSFPIGDEAAELNAAFDAAYEEMFGIAPDDQGPFHAQAYDAISLLANALSRAAVPDDGGLGYLMVDRLALIDAIRATTDLQGLSGVLTCNAIGDCGAGGIQIFEVQDGAFVQVSGFGMD